MRSDLVNIRPTSLTVSAAFGSTAQPTEMGDLPPFMLPTIVIKEMDTVLLSVSQLCALGMVGIFTEAGCRFYQKSTVMDLLKKINQHGEETMRGTVENGLYVQESK